MTTQVTTTVPQPPTPQGDFTVEFRRTIARISIARTEDSAPEVDLYIPKAWSLTKPEALEVFAALRVLLAAAEGALRANDGVGEREGEGWGL